MTTPWKIEPIWAGATVAILGSSAGMSQQVADVLAVHTVIACHRALRYAPQAAMWVQIDADVATELTALVRDYQGMRVCAIECERDALYPGLMYEMVNIGPNHQVQLRNNVLSAMRIAAQAGATRLVLAGVDAAAYDQMHAAGGFYGFAQGLAQVTAELQAQGVAVDHYTPVPVAAAAPAEVVEVAGEVSGDGTGQSLPPVDPDAFLRQIQRARPR